MREQQGLTRIAGYPDRSQAVAGAAFFAGTGPFYKTCNDCTFFKYIAHQRRCGKYVDLTGKSGPPIPSTTKACKYFEDRK